jgi:acyl-CoA synthetase (AMP-forming)/AMP-acid ligase II
LSVGFRKRLARLSAESISIPVIEIETDFDALSIPRVGFQPVAVREDDPACILYTSGTTGRAKGAVLSHRSLIASVGLQTLNGAAMFMASGLKTPPPAPCTLLTTPLFHVSGLVAGVVMMLSAGARVVLREGRFDPVDVMRLIERERVTSWSTTPTMAHRVVNHPEISRFDLSSLRNLGSGGSALSEALQETIRERLPSCAQGVGLGYGLTESGGIATINSGEELATRPTSAGRAMPCVKVEIRDARGLALEEGQEGEIYIQSPLVMLGYWRNDAATAEALAPGRWLRTGDVGLLDEGHLYINSRARDLILRGGENVYPTEVEHVLEEHPRVDEAAVVGKDHEELGQEVVAFVVPRDGASLGLDDLRKWAAERLAGFKVPTHIRFQRTPLPRNATGKLLKSQLISELENTLIEDQT